MASAYLDFAPAREADDQEDDDRGEVDEERLHQTDFAERRADGADHEQEDSGWSQHGGCEQQQLVHHVQNRHVLVHLDQVAPALSHQNQAGVKAKVQNI